MRSAEKFTAAFAHHGEGPFWDSRGDRLLCCDVFEGHVVEIASDGAIHRHDLEQRAVTVVRHRAREGFIVATDKELIAVDNNFGRAEPVATLVNDSDVRLNDGGCDPFGNFVVGSMRYDEKSRGGAVYKVAPGGKSRPVIGGVTVSNGVQWSADGSRVFYIDSPTQWVDTFDVDPHSGDWLRRHKHISLEEAEGVPDGMAIDDEDGLWIAMWGGSSVRHYDRHGQLIEIISVPGVTQVSSCAFGGERRRTLFITTSRKDLVADEPNAGAVFCIETSCSGALLAEYSG
ncbi:MAG: SMP-30/gluconolactonase/LRE family protein [Mycobacterium kyogaense]|uniref:SMP-30/gluconolactonase/LRE family protein n=1 Tax=Mycobacterium kyogaense TaxID=2212479 RepID=UPI002FF8392C